MTREEQEQAIRAVAHICKGPLLSNEGDWPETWARWFGVKDPAPVARAIGDVPALWGRWFEIEESGDIDAAETMIGELRERRNQIAALLAPGFSVGREPSPAGLSFVELRRIALPLIRLRAELVGKPCAFDLAEEFCKVDEFRGQELKYRCPRCGNFGKWRAPVFY